MRPEHLLRTVEAGLVRHELALAARRVLEIGTSGLRLLLREVHSQATSEEGRLIIEVVLHRPHWKVATHPKIIRITLRVKMSAVASEG